MWFGLAGGFRFCLLILFVWLVRLRLLLFDLYCYCLVAFVMLRFDGGVWILWVCLVWFLCLLL